MSRFIAVAVGTVLALPGCNQMLGASAQLDPYSVLPGKWGWNGSSDCDVSPEEIRFSTDRKQMFLAHAPIKDDDTREPHREVTYQILRILPNGISMSLDGEDRLDSSGKPVTWDLILLDQDRYCWHRSDWRSGGCTKPVDRCEI